MNKIKTSINAFLGISLIVLVGAVITTNAQAPTTSKDVNVVNTPSVNVANPVGLAPGTIVGISSTNNTVRLASNTLVTVRGEKTEIIYNQVVTAFCCPPAITALVDVSAYKQIRIVASLETVNNSVLITPYLHFSNDPNANYSERVTLDDSYQNSMNRVYDTPGQYIRVQLQGSGSVKIMIFGRRG
jgi:hypothetical protein